MGYDQRTSTSKTFIFLWTLLVTWGLLCLLIAGTLVRMHGCVAGHTVSEALKACRSLPHSDRLGLLQVGWSQFLSGPLSGSYIVLLAIPTGAGVAAKVITQTKDDAGTLRKTKPVQHANRLRQSLRRVAEVFSSDDGDADIGDFQYSVFNLILATYFVAAMLNYQGEGLPTLPDTLLGLTSVSAAVYVGKKAAARSKPSIANVFPQPLSAGTPFVVTGSGLSDPAQVGANPPAISINGIRIPTQADGAIPDRLTGNIPVGVVPVLGAGGTNGTLQVMTGCAEITDPFNVQLG